MTQETMTTHAKTCRCSTSLQDATVPCPLCAKRQLLAHLEAAPNAPITREDQTALIIETDKWLSSLVATKPAAPDGPDALPPHITPLGEHHCLRGGRSLYWIGGARATPSELGHVRGLVIYNRDTHIFLAEDEMRDALSMAGSLLEHLALLQEDAPGDRNGKVG